MIGDTLQDEMEVHPLTSEGFCELEAEFLRVSADLPEVSWTREQFLSERKNKFELSFWLGSRSCVVAYVVMSEVDAQRVHIHHLMVSMDNRGHGLGSNLIAIAVARARTFGAKILSLKVPVLFEASQRFYRRHGFVAIRVEGDYVYMEFRLESET